MPEPIAALRHCEGLTVEEVDRNSEEALDLCEHEYARRLWEWVDVGRGD